MPEKPTQLYAVSAIGIPLPEFAQRLTEIHGLEIIEAASSAEAVGLFTLHAQLSSAWKKHAIGSVSVRNASTRTVALTR